MTQTVYLNGSFVSEAEAVVSVFDGGFLHGAGLFETMCAQNGRIFRLETHLDRLRRSARKLLGPMRRDDLPSEGAFAELLERNGLAAARVRLTVSAGSVLEKPDGGARRLTVCATASRLEPYADAMYEQGVQVAVCDFRQSRTHPTAGHKTTAYLPRLIALREASRAGCMETLWFNERNQLAEGSISNVFVVRDGVLKTPPLDTPVLPGIARGVVLELAKCTGVVGPDPPCTLVGIETREVPLTINELLDASEVFLTNALMWVMPVVRVEKRDIGNGKVGPVAKRLLDAYRSLVRKECGVR